MKREILDLLANSVEFDLPNTLVDDEYQSVCMAMNPNQQKLNDKDHSNYCACSCCYLFNDLYFLWILFCLLASQIQFLRFLKRFYAFH